MSKVTHLFLKTAHKTPMASQESVKAQVGFGLVGNLHGGGNTPRQVLIASLDSLNKYNLQPGDLKENIVIDNFPVNELKSGQVVQIGEVKIRISFNCEPCGYIESLQSGLLRKIEGERGILGIVLNDGEIRIGDSIELLPDIQYCEVPYKIADRFIWLVEQIPEGKVLSYRTIIETLGLWSSVYRALPAFIKRLDPEIYPVHRIVNSQGDLLGILPNQKTKLITEGLEIVGGSVDLTKYEWDVTGLYTKLSSK